MAAAGTVTAAIAADRASDAAGNGNTASSSTDDSVTWVPNRQPTAVITDGQCSPAGPASASVTVTVADPDGDPLTVALTANSNRTLIPDAQVSIGGSDDTRTIGVAAAAGRSGTATLRFGVSDGIATVSLTLTVRVGTNGSQTLVGTSGSDILLGLGGTDVLGGGDGADLLCGGDGNDIMTGGAGADTVDGQAGNDGVDGGAGSDAVFGGPGNDGLRGGAGADRFSGGPGRDLALDFRANQGDTQDGTIP
jgi:Ca2+-binding RTX toxin-like protein